VAVPLWKEGVSLVREQKQPRLGGKRGREMEHGGGGGGGAANAGSDSKKPTRREKSRENPQLSNLD